MKFEKFDRELQREILTLAVSVYPDIIGRPALKNPPFNGTSPDKLIANISYLVEHKLLVSESFANGKMVLNPHALKATKDGVDFMLDDGGLSAILNTITVRFDDIALNSLINAVNQSSVSNHDKQKLISQLKALPGDAIKHLSLKLLDVGLSKTPNVVQWLCDLIR